MTGAAGSNGRSGEPRPESDGRSDEILVSIENDIGFLTLNRPRAINSLTHAMVNTMRQVLTEWERDDGVRAVVLRGSGERGLCAGGDIVAVYRSATGDHSEAEQFWYDEYLLNAQIGRYPKPYVALMDGIVMGGGIGVSAHANTRVVTDTSKLAMPEVGIGLVPDVGGTYLLSRAPGKTGLHAALSGEPFSGADAIAMGFADHYVPHAALEAFTRDIAARGVAAALDRHAVAPPSSERISQRSWIDECYAADTVAEIVSALRAHDVGPAHDAADLIVTRSPTALSVALESVRRAGRLDTLEDVLKQEYRAQTAMLRTHDLVEGIRAQVIDKDRNPKWSPASLTDISAADVEAFFAPADRELEF